MEYLGRNEGLSDWNFSEKEIEYGKEVLEHPSIEAAAKRVAENMGRMIELKSEKTIAPRFELQVSMGMNRSGSVSVSGEKGLPIGIQRCGNCDVHIRKDYEAKGVAWAVYQKCLPILLEEYPAVAGHNLEVMYNKIFRTVVIIMYLKID